MFEQYGKTVVSAISLAGPKRGTSKRASAPSNRSCVQRIARRSTDLLDVSDDRWIFRGLDFSELIVTFAGFIHRQHAAAGQLGAMFN